MTPARITTVCVAGAVSVLFVILAKMGSGPQLYPGDKTEIRTCRWCNGSGIEANQEEGTQDPRTRPGGPCVGCHGAKKLSVVMPGPNHPASVKGTVRDAQVGRDLPVEALLMENRQPMRPVAGAVGGAKIVFAGPSRQVETLVGPNGRFRAMLQPGHYTVKLSAAGYKESTEQLDVAPLREPIWQEKAHLVTPEKEADVTRVDYLMEK